MMLNNQWMKRCKLIEIQDKRRTSNSHDLEKPIDEKEQVGRNSKQEADIAII